MTKISSRPSVDEEAGDRRALLVDDRILDQRVGEGAQIGDEGAGGLQCGEGDAGDAAEEQADQSPRPAAAGRALPASAGAAAAAWSSTGATSTLSASASSRRMRMLT